MPQVQKIDSKKLILFILNYNRNNKPRKMNTETTTQNKQNWEECLCDESIFCSFHFDKNLKKMVKMKNELKRQIQDYFPQCRCEDWFGTDSNPYNERCSICDEGLSGVADKIAKATKLCVEKTTKAFSDNWDSEFQEFMRYLNREELERISYWGNPSDLLDWFETEPESELTNFGWMTMNLRLHWDKDKMLREIIDKANDELWAMREIERKEKESQPKKIKVRVIRKKD